MTYIEMTNVTYSVATSLECCEIWHSAAEKLRMFAI